MFRLFYKPNKTQCQFLSMTLVTIRDCMLDFREGEKFPRIKLLESIPESQYQKEINWELKINRWRDLKIQSMSDLVTMLT